MSLIIDFLLLAASGAACFYCFILNKRLTALSNTKDGLHTGIASLSQSTQEMQNALSNTKDMAMESASNLEALLASADKMLPEIQELLQQITTISAQAVTETESATESLVAALSPHIEDARASAKLLLSTLATVDERNAPAATEEPAKPVKVDPRPDAEILPPELFGDEEHDLEFEPEAEEDEESAEPKQKGEAA